MTQAHTPGPWSAEVAPSSDYDCIRWINGSDGQFVAKVRCKPGHTTQDEALANARLIAKAPELLAVLDKLLTTADHNGVTQLYENRQGNPHVKRCRFGDALAEARTLRDALIEGETT